MTRHVTFPLALIVRKKSSSPASFGTHVTAMFAGIAISSLVTSAAFYESLPILHDTESINTSLSLSSLVNMMVAQSPIIIIFGARGQTSLAFYSFFCFGWMASLSSRLIHLLITSSIFEVFLPSLCPSWCTRLHGY